MDYFLSLGSALRSLVLALGDHHLSAEGKGCRQPEQPPVARSNLSLLEPQLLSQATQGGTASQNITHPSQLMSSTDATA